MEVVNGIGVQVHEFGYNFGFCYSEKTNDLQGDHSCLVDTPSSKDVGPNIIGMEKIMEIPLIFRRQLYRWCPEWSKLQSVSYGCRGLV